MVATLSKPIVIGVLREELGFDGVIMTDSFTMGGIVAQFDVAEAAVQAIEAGVDLILLKDENALLSEVALALIQAVESGRLSEARLDDSIRRTLRLKERFGLLDPRAMSRQERAQALIQTDARPVAIEASRRGIACLRDATGQLPLATDAKVLVVEQAFGLQLEVNDARPHPGALAHALLDRGVDVRRTEFCDNDLDAAWPTIEAMAAEADVVIHTGQYKRGGHTRGAIHRRFTTLDTPSIFIANSPYPEVVSPDMQTVLVSCSLFVEAAEAVADVLVGRLSPVDFPFDPTRVN
jgi:beta-N-acetylhexosaminidase